MESQTDHVALNNRIVFMSAADFPSRQKETLK